MAKGKHKARTDRATEVAEQQQIVALRQELADEYQRLAAGHAKATEARAAEARLKQVIERRDRSVAGEVERLTAVLNELGAAVEAEEHGSERIQRAWSRFSKTILSSVGGQGVERMERLMALLNGYSVQTISNNKRLSPRRSAALEVARGERSEVVGEDFRRPEGLLWARPWYRTRGEASDAPRRIAAIANEAANSMPWRLTPDVAYAWAMSLAFEIPSQAERFGLCEDMELWAEKRPPVGVVAKATAEAMERDAEVIRGRWRNPMQPMPLFPRPVDALALRWWYRLYAASSEVFFEGR